MSRPRRARVVLPWIAAVAFLLAAPASSAPLATAGDTIAIGPAPSCVDPGSCTDFTLTFTNTGSKTINGMTIQVAAPNANGSFALDGQPAFTPTGVQNAFAGFPISIPAGATVTGSGTAMQPLANGADFTLFTTPDGFATATGEDAKYRATPNCDPQRAAVAAAEAKLAALESERAAIGPALTDAQHDLEVVKEEFDTVQLAAAAHPIVALVGALDEARDAFYEAEGAVTALDFKLSILGADIRDAEAKLAQAKTDLAGCESGTHGLSASPLEVPAAAVPAAARPAKCGTEQSALAAAQATASVLGAGAKTFGGPRLPHAEHALRGGIAALSKVIADPRARAWAAKLQIARADAQKADKLMRTLVARIAGLAHRALAASAAATRAQGAVKACQTK